MNSPVDRLTQIDATVSLAGLEINPSEVHGIIIGAIASHLKSGLTPDLLKLVEPEADANDGRFARLNEMLYDLYRENSEILFNGGEGFELVLPEDESPIAEQVEGIATWCKGYLLGLLHTDTFGIDQLPESGAEISRDLMEISEAGVDEETDQDEWALAELQEYVKVGSQLIFEFIYSERSTEAPKTQQ